MLKLCYELLILFSLFAHLHFDFQLHVVQKYLISLLNVLKELEESLSIGTYKMQVQS